MTNIERVDTVEEFHAQDISVGFTGSTQSPVLDGITLRIDRGEFVSIVGGSGTGKTTLLRTLGGIQIPARGTIRYRGTPINGPAPGVVIVFQDYVSSLLRWRTVWRNVSLGVEDVKDRDWRRDVDRAIELVGLRHVAGEYPWRLSGGMQQRVQIARALAVRPSALLMDEPFGALDALTKATMQDELLKVQEAIGATVVFVTHDVDEAIYLSDRVILLSGRPATITHEIGVDLPRPRDQVGTRESPQYLNYRREVLGWLSSGEL